jgi:RNA-directed DNA polymerase
MNEETRCTISSQLFACAAKAANSEQKRAHLIGLPQLVLELADSIARQRYQPSPFTVFAVTDPKLREIFAPAFADRLVQHWIVHHVEPWWDKRFIDDSYANRKGKGTQAAIERLQAFMRKPGMRWYCKLDIRAFFPSIDRRILLHLWRQALPRLPWPQATRQRLDHVTTAIITQSPVDPPPVRSGDTALLALIPPHKSLFGAPPGVGMPIGSLTSQFFANVYLNELDQFVKHTLKARCYLRYVDDFILLADDPHTLLRWQAAIGRFLQERLHLQLHPQKMVLQRCSQGADFLGAIVFPTHRLARQRTVRALRRRLAWFKSLLFADTAPATGAWQRWLQRHDALVAPGQPTHALLQRMLSTLNSYYGFLSDADTWRLRRHIYQHELGPLRKFFLPDGPRYRHLHIRKVWLPHPPGTHR